MIRYVVSRFQQRLTQPLVRAYASSGNAPKVLVPRIPQPRDEVVQAAEMRPPLLPPCPKTQCKPVAPEARTTPYPKDPVAGKDETNAAAPSMNEQHKAAHPDEVVNNIGGAPVNLLHH